MLYQTKNLHGGDIYEGHIELDFSANGNPYGTPESVRRAIADATASLHHYPDPYCRSLTAAIAASEDVPQEYILCGNGAGELIYSYCTALRPKIAVETAPTFSEYGLALEQVGCMVEHYPLTQSNDFLLTDAFCDFLYHMQPEVIFLCNPNNPTGQLIPTGLLYQVLTFCHHSGCRLFVDECFLDLCSDGESFKPFLEEYPELFLLKAFTKSYGMAGVRLGYGLCSDNVLLRKMSQTVQPWNVSALAQVAGVAALQETDFLKQTQILVNEERIYLQKELEALRFYVCPSHANYLLFRGSVGLCEVLRERGIALRNCDNYYGLGPGWYRSAILQHKENETLMNTLRTILREGDHYG